MKFTKFEFKSASFAGKAFFITCLGILAACFTCGNIYAERAFTATARENIPTAIQQIAQISAQSLSSHVALAQASAPNGNQSTPPPVEQQNPQQKFDPGTISEAFGHLLVKNMENPGFKFDIDRVIKGMHDEMAGKPSPLTDDEYEQAVISVQEKIFNELAEKNLQEANAFLEQNATAPGVIVLIPNKLQYKIIKEGNGPVVEPHSTPLIHYTGRYLDGTVFGSSRELGEPISLPLDQTIVGFSKGLLGMKEGEKRILFIHPDLGYGLMGQLPPNSLLVFEVDLVKANSQPEKTEQPQEPTKPQTPATPETKPAVRSNR